MTAPSPIKPPRNSWRQRGAAILIMVLILMLGLITLFTFRMDRKGPELEAERKTAMALAQAKEALLGNSATNNNPGRFPCPDLDNDGGWGKNNVVGFGSNCPAGSQVGRFPWSFVKLDDVRDGVAERLWYVVDNSFIDYNGAAINSTKVPTLTFNGIPVVAVIISPSAVLSGLLQDRSTSGPNPPSNNAANYLESISALPLIGSAPVSPIYNDRIITITTNDLLNIVTQRMVREFITKLGGPPYPTTYPFPTPPPALPPPLDIWDQNEWYNAATYTYIGTASNPNQFRLTFANCASVFTVVWSGTGNTISRSGNC